MARESAGRGWWRRDLYGPRACVIGLLVFIQKRITRSVLTVFVMAEREVVLMY